MPDPDKPMYKLRTKMSRIYLIAACMALLAIAGIGCNASSDAPAQSSPDEPVAEDSAFNTAIGFTVTMDPGERLPQLQPEPQITDQEFEQGLPEAVVSVPDTVDPATNQPPFFIGLQNVTVEAGEMVSILFDPEDPEGDLPGMFIEKLPQGATFDDNFDGTKTFNWQPLQMDVGILRLTAVAIDPDDQSYLTTQAVLVKVTEAEDPASIPNVAPSLDPVRVFTARAGDPVVFELKGIDLNGSIPTIEIPALPDGASFNQHPRFEEIFVLKFIPTQAGELSIDVLLRDSTDPSLTANETITLNVSDDVSLQRDGERLKTLAQSRSVLIGFAALQSFYHQPDGALYASIAGQEFNVVTPENSMKMDTINPLPGRYQFAATDNLIAYAQHTDMQVRGHPLLWHRQLPDWVLETPIEDLESVMTQHINVLLDRYGNDVAFWDVVNEPINEDGSMRESIWFESMGESYIDKSLSQVRAMLPDSVLLINEFDIGMAGPKFDGLMQLLDRLQSRGTPVDAVGFQMHVFSSYDQFNELRANFQAVVDRGLDIHITELDVSLADGNASLQDQASVYEQIVSICLEFSQCRVIQMWGFTDQYSFRSIFDPLPFDRAYQSKPVYQALQSALSATP